jgi:hypothetical protein
MMSREAVAQLARDVPSLTEIDAELAHRLTADALDTELSRRGLVVMRMLMPQHGRRTGQIFACSARMAEGYAIYGSAIRVTS